MTEFLRSNGNGSCDRVIRGDAIKLHNPERWYVPTRNETKWVSNMDEFRAAGGQICWSEDQAEIELLLPEGYKFSIQMFRKDKQAERIRP